jgi:hypothetical protein
MKHNGLAWRLESTATGVNFDWNSVRLMRSCDMLSRIKGRWSRFFSGAALVVVVFSLGSCFNSSVTPPPVAAKDLPKVYQANAQAYVRTVQSGSDTFSVQTASLVFRRAGSPEIELVGAMHAAESSYYQSLQKRLSRADLVLYELVVDERDAKENHDAMQRAEEKSAFSRLAAAQGLVSQNRGIDVKKKNFRRCDMTFQQMIAKLQEEAKQGAGQGGQAKEAKREFAKLGRVLDGRSWMMNAVVRLVGMNHGLRERVRFMLVASGQASDEDDSLHPRLQQLILEDRNEFAMNEIAKVLRRENHQRIAIFYGAAHLPDMEKRLVRMGYRAAGTRQWNDAIVSHPYSSGISDDEVQQMLKEAR